MLVGMQTPLCYFRYVTKMPLWVQIVQRSPLNFCTTLSAWLVHCIVLFPAHSSVEYRSMGSGHPQCPVCACVRARACVFYTARRLPSVSYDHSEFIDRELAVLPELRLTRHLLPERHERQREQADILSACRPPVCVTCENTFIQEWGWTQKAALWRGERVLTRRLAQQMQQSLFLNMDNLHSITHPSLSANEPLFLSFFFFF